MTHKKNITAPLIFLIISAIVVYFPIYKNNFIGFDDHTYIYQNEILKKGLTFEGIKFAFSLNNGTSYWHPLTWLSLLLDAELWGLNPVGYHIENLLWHILNGAILFFILNKLSGKTYPSAAVALLFLIHPCNVESVAWGVERKTLLSSFLFFVTIATYIKYVENRKIVTYIAMLLLFALGLMAKSMIVTLPLILLLLDIYPLERWNIRSDGGAPASIIAIPLIIEKIPLFCLSVISVVLSILSHSHSNMVDKTSFLSKLLFLPATYFMHLKQTIFPASHSIFFKFPASFPYITTYIALISFAILIGYAFYNIKKSPYFFTAIFWFLITLLPMSGLVRAGKWPYFADRFLYLPAIGVFMLIIHFIYEQIEKNRRVMKPSIFAFAIISIFFAYSTNKQVSSWQNSISLFSQAVKTDTQNSYAHYLLGRSYLIEKKDYKNGEKHLLTAISLEPDELYYKADLGELYLTRGEIQKSISLLKPAADVFFTDLSILNSLASAYIETFEYDSAITVLRKILNIKPDHEAAIFNMGVALYKNSNFTEAKKYFENGTALFPKNIDFQINLANSYIAVSAFQYAENILNKIEMIEPNNLNIILTKAELFEKIEKKEAAIDYYKKAVAIDQSSMIAKNALKRLELR